MRTRSQGPVTHEGLVADEPEVPLSPNRSGDGQHRTKRREGMSLSVDVEEASTRTSFESPRSALEGNVEVRRLNTTFDKTSGPDEKRPMRVLESAASPQTMASALHERHQWRLRSPWTCSSLTLLIGALAAILAVLILYSFTARQLDPKGCTMSYMRPSFAKFADFDTEHTRFASKYSLYLYREGEIDEDTRVKGIPVLFIPGNAGSYKQVRPFAAEAAVFYHETLQNDPEAYRKGKRPLDFFTVDFNEDITAFHGQTLLDQAEYLNEAVSYILSLYHNPSRSIRDSDLPDPVSVILLGHSMGGIVARTMLTMANHQSNSINTIVTLAAPHARAPVSFDAEIVRSYKRINDYWRNAYSQKWANNNPLWHVTLISIAGGGLDTVVPSDYSTIASIVPPTHGFTVFTSTIPTVWTAMDHLAITWCDQLRKSLIRALYEVVDAGRPAQTRPRAERMYSFKKWLLTGLEDVAEKTLPHKEPKTLLTLEDNSNAIISQGERLVLRQFGESGKPKAYLLPVPPQDSTERKRFALMTDQNLGQLGSQDHLEIMFCSVFPLHAGHSSTVFSMNMDLSGDSSGSTRLACKNAAADVILLPASNQQSKYPFDNVPPFSYLQYDLEQLSEHQFVAIIDKSSEVHPGWLIAEFASRADSTIQTHKGLSSLVFSGLEVSSVLERPMMVEINIPSLQSSLLAYKLSIDKQSCVENPELFTPLLRQHISDPYESKFHVNVKEVEISLHGIAPYIPPALRSHSRAGGLSLQIWSDPTCNNTLEVSLKVDGLGSMGKLWMRYRTVFAAFPLLVVALVLRKQFKIYDETGVFMSFSESMDQCLFTSIPLLFLAVTICGMSFVTTGQGAHPSTLGALLDWNGNATETPIDFTQNDLILGSTDPFFWFLVPLFALISIGICIALNYIVLCLTFGLSLAFSWALKVLRRPFNAFTFIPLRRRLVTTSILVFLVWTILPYQFLFIVLCFAQLATCVRALSLARENNASASFDFYNYAHSILLLMLWILPINLPTLVVWIHNLAVHWLTPFSSHHNVLSILPFVLLVETLSTGKMVPRVTTWVRHLTSVLFFLLALYSAVYGITFAYLLHSIVNIVCVWLMVIYSSRSSFSVAGFTNLIETVDSTRHAVKKQP